MFVVFFLPLTLVFLYSVNSCGLAATGIHGPERANWFTSRLKRSNCFSDCLLYYVLLCRIL